MKNLLLKISISWLCVVLSAPLAASLVGPNSHVVVLGDSLSDTGNLAALTGGALPPSPLYDPPRQQRYSNGDVWVDAFAATFGLGLNTVTIPFGPPAGNGFVDNYAIAGALSGSYELTPAVAGFTDINNFADVFNAVNDPGMGDLDIPGFAQQVGVYLFGGADPDATHIIWVGANDLLYADILAPPTAATVPEQVALNIQNALLALNAAGVGHLVVANLPDLGKTPFADGNLVAPIVSPDPATLTARTLAFNQALDDVLASLSFEVGLVDIFALVEEAIAFPARFGFTNTDDTCLDLMTLGTACGNPDEYIFWDDLHPTSAAHAFVAQEFVQAVVPLPGTLALLVAGCVLVPAVRRRARSSLQRT